MGGLRLEERPNILGSPIIFLQRLGLETSYLARSWGMPRHIINHTQKGGHGPRLEKLPSICEFSFNIYTTAKARVKIWYTAWVCQSAPWNHTPRTSGHGLGLAKLPYIWGCPLIFLQQPRCPLSVSGTSFCFRVVIHKYGATCFYQAKLLECLNLKFDSNWGLIWFEIWAKLICDLRCDLRHDL